jgi:hypothetical protein
MSFGCGVSGFDFGSGSGLGDAVWISALEDVCRSEDSQSTDYCCDLGVRQDSG